MGTVDLLLNLACALLWLNWRSFRLAPVVKSKPVSLAGTVKHADPRQRGRWASFCALLAILAARSVFYWNVGPAINWTPTLELGVISLPFRSDYLNRMFLFSGLSFGLMLGSVYAWLLLLSVVNRCAPPDEPFQRLVRLHLGWVERWPAPLRFFLPMILTVALWPLASHGLVNLGIVPAPASTLHVWEQAVLLGVSSLLIWKVLLMLICILYLVNSYVYLGRSQVWAFINMTGANLLRKLRRFPVCVGKIDLSPLLALVLVLVVTHWADRWLPQLFERLPL
jgi:uncharacterized protein YggT (Ycf19 family)